MRWGSKWSPLLGVFERERARLARRLAQQADDSALLAASLRAEFVEVPRSILHRRLQGVAERLTFALEDGAVLSEAMSEHPGDFEDWEVALVSAAERCDQCSRALEAWTSRLVNAAELKDGLSSVLIYPITLALLAGGASIILLATLIPTMARLFTGLGEELPLSTRLWIAASNLVAEQGGLLVLLVLLSVGLASCTLGRPLDRLSLSRMRYRAPWFGPAAASGDRAIALELFRGLAAAGLPPAGAVELAAAALPSRAGRAELSELATSLRDGGSLEDSAVGLLLDRSTRRALGRAWASTDPVVGLDGLARSEATRSRRAADRGLLFIEPLSVALIGFVLAFGLVAAMEPLQVFVARVGNALP